MRKMIAAMALVASASVNATLIQVEYEGTVTRVRDQTYPRCLCPHLYSVGDPFEGSLVLDTALAPADIWRDPHIGHYRQVQDTPDFLIGRTVSQGDISDDVEILDDYLSEGRLIDSYTLVDEWQDGILRDSLLINVMRPASAGQLVSGDGLVQSFEAVQGDGSTMNAYYTRGSGRYSRMFTIALTRVTMTVIPGTCSGR